MDNTIQELLVEGNDDRHLILSIYAKFNVAQTFEIKDLKGIDEILKGLPVRLKGSGKIQTIGVVVDADLDVDVRWLQLRKILIDSGLYENVPVECPREGLIMNPLNDDSIRFGLWIMPDNRGRGMLEDFAALLIPENDNLLPVVDNVLCDIETKGLNKYKSCHHSKARIHTWLAWQENPGTPMGLAVTKKYLTTTSPLCQAFVDWLNNLFNVDNVH